MERTKLKGRRPSELPSEYKFLKVLGEGVFGKVLKCVKRETREIVAIKMPKILDNDTENEVGTFVDFDVNSCKTYFTVKVALISRN